MRKILWLPFLTAVCGFTSLRADVTLVEHVDGVAPVIDCTVMVKSEHTRVDYAVGLSAITNLKTSEVIRLLRPQKRYVRIPGHPSQASVGAMKQSPVLPRGGGLAVTPTGKKDTISGYAAEEYTCSSNGTKMGLWLTKAVPNYANLLKEMPVLFDGNSIGGILAAIGLDIATLPGFPVRLVNERPSGQTINTTILTVSTAPIADSEFDIPVDYQEF